MYRAAPEIRESRSFSGLFRCERPPTPAVVSSRNFSRRYGMGLVDPPISQAASWQARADAFALLESEANKVQRQIEESEAAFARIAC